MEAHPGVEEEQEQEAPREGGGEGKEGSGGAGQVIWAGSGQVGGQQYYGPVSERLITEVKQRQNIMVHILKEETSKEKEIEKVKLFEHILKLHIN